MPELGASLPVEPEDHEAFCQLYGRYGPHADRVRSGFEDNDWRLQVLARHRVDPAVKQLRELLGQALRINAVFIGSGSIEINPLGLLDTKRLYALFEKLVAD